LVSGVITFNELVAAIKRCKRCEETVECDSHPDLTTMLEQVRVCSIPPECPLSLASPVYVFSTSRVSLASTVRVFDTSRVS
jgi:hypothetical protein